MATRRDTEGPGGKVIMRLILAAVVVGGGPVDGRP